MYFPMYFDPTYVLVILGVIICLAASAKMRSTFNKYSRVRSRTGMTGREAAEYVLRSAGIYDVRVDKDGFLVQTGKGLLKVTALQIPGKKRMEADAFLRGYSMEPGEKLGIKNS